MGRTLHQLIAATTVAVALFGLCSGVFIYLQYSGATLGLGIAALSAGGGLLGVGKAVRLGRRSGSKARRRTRSDRLGRI